MSEDKENDNCGLDVAVGPIINCDSVKTVEVNDHTSFLCKCSKVLFLF